MLIQMRLSYNPESERQCLACGSIKGKLPYRKIVMDPTIDIQGVLLECGHFDYSIGEFKAMHPTWEW